MVETADDVPPLFCELDVLSYSIPLNQYECWREKARWIKFEEQAEDVLGRWSKPHVATIPQSAINDLNHLFKEGIVILDASVSSIRDAADLIANKLISYFNNFDHAGQFAEIMCLPHIHHHEKKAKRSMSGANLIKMSSSSNFQEFGSRKDNFEPSNQNVVTASKSLKYQYSFTDSICFDEFTSMSDFKENTKFKRKIHRKAEGASVLVAPLNFVHHPKLVFLRLETATDLAGFLEVKLKSKFIAIIIGPVDKQIQIYEIGRAISTCLTDDVCKELFYTATSKSDILNTIQQFSNSSVILPPIWDPKTYIEPPEKVLTKAERKATGDNLQVEELLLESHVDTNLKGSRRPFVGLKSDLKRKLPFFLSDITDVFNIQCIAATLYIYLVSLCSLVAFGGLFGKYTNHQIGMMECVLSGAVCGAIFAIFSGQPLNILSATGPMLILEGIIYKLSKENSLEFLEFRLWIGLWTAFILILFAVFNLSVLVKYITRFTEECFASLVAILFIMDAFKSVFKIYNDYPTQLGPLIFGNSNKIKKTVEIAENLSNNSFIIDNIDELNETIFNKNCSGPICKTLFKQKGNIPDVFFFSLLLFFLTFTICMLLKNFRDSNFFPAKARQIISDFAALVGIVSMSLLDLLIGIDTPKLNIPSTFQPSNANRSWLVPLYSGKNPVWTIFLAILPAIFTTILIFMDQQITAVIINRKEFKLKKSYGYHLDLLVLAITIAVSSAIGAPWFVAATVLALTHVNALKVMSENTAPGEKPLFLGVKEQRMSGFLMSVLIGFSILLTSVLKHIPMPVLYAVFLFMGVNTLNGIQFIDRILVLFIPVKYQPDYPYLKHVSALRIHLFTFIQLLSVIGLILVKSIESIAITLPLMIVATGGIRKLLEFVYTQEELYWLDDILPPFRKKRDQADEKTDNSDHSEYSKKDKKGKKVNDSDKEASETMLCYSQSEMSKISKKDTHEDETQSKVQFAIHYPDNTESEY